MNYKYAVGQTVIYKEYKNKYKTCKTCGHEDYIIVDVKKRGVIEKVGLQNRFNLSNGFGPSAKGEQMPIPEWIREEPILAKMWNEQVACYRIGGIWYEESGLTLARGK